MVGCFWDDYSRERARSRLKERQIGDASARKMVLELVAVVGAVEERRTRSMAGSIWVEAGGSVEVFRMSVFAGWEDEWSRQFRSGRRRNTQIRYNEPSMLRPEKPWRLEMASRRSQVVRDEVWEMVQARHFAGSRCDCDRCGRWIAEWCSAKGKSCLVGAAWVARWVGAGPVSGSACALCCAVLTFLATVAGVKGGGADREE